LNVGRSKADDPETNLLTFRPPDLSTSRLALLPRLPLAPAADGPPPHRLVGRRPREHPRLEGRARARLEVRRPLEHERREGLAAAVGVVPRLLQRRLFDELGRAEDDVGHPPVRLPPL